MKVIELNYDELGTVKKKCVTFASNGNTVIKPYKSLLCMEKITHNPKHANIYLGEIECGYAYIWEDYGVICYRIGNMRDDVSIEDLARSLERYGIGKEYFIKRLENMESMNSYINLVDIETLYLMGETELAKHYMAYRENLKREIEKEKELEDIERVERNQKEEKERLETIEKKIKDIELKIFHEEDFKCFDVGGTSIINLLMRKYGIDVPLRTQGWINSKLAMVIFEDGISYRFRGKSQRDNSTVFRDYLNKLKRAIDDELALPFC